MQNPLPSITKFLTSLFKFLFKLIIGIIAWIAISKGLYHFLQQQNPIIDPKKFMVCMIDKDHRLYSDGSMGNISFPMLSEVTDQPPCDTPTPDREIWYKADWVLEQVDNDEWEMQFYMGYWNDPHIFHYRVENGKIIPMWQAYHLELGLAVLAMFISAIITPILMAKFNHLVNTKILKKCA